MDSNYSNLSLEDRIFNIYHPASYRTLDNLNLLNSDLLNSKEVSNDNNNTNGNGDDNDFAEFCHGVHREFFANSGEDDDGVVDGVTHDHQDSGQHRSSELSGTAPRRTEDNKQADCHENVVHGGNHGSDCIAELETQGHV